MMKIGYLIHYGELSLKGKNRSFFENKLLDNIRQKYPEIGIKKKYGRALLFGDDNRIENVLKTTFGISNWAKVYIFDLIDLNDLSNNIINLILDLKINLEGFKVITKRSNKNYQPNSMEISKQIGAHILQKLGGKVEIKNPISIIYIEIDDSNIYVYFNKFKGLGGLPIGTTGKIVSLISGGIDSPVASFLMMKRGCEVIFLHGYNERLDKNGVTRKKIIDLIKILANYQGKVKLYLFPVADITKWILENVEPNYRMLIFKIMLVKISNLISDKENCLAITTGDNIAQVASQTLENLNIIYSYAQKIVLPPLLGYDKEEIIKKAKNIGTYDISTSQKCEDVCSKISSQHPILKGNFKIVDKILKNFNDDLLNNLFEKTEVFKI